MFSMVRGGRLDSFGMAASERDDVCAICLEPLPRWYNEYIRFTCCGKGVHDACSDELRASAYADKCPMCRAHQSVTALETHRRSLKWAERGKNWAMYSVAGHYKE